jgi:hypothetical protein
MERVGDAVRNELERFGPAPGMAAIVEAWPAAVGSDIARNAWPARVARDGTLHVHTSDSVWAFELKSRAEDIRRRLGEHAPPKLAFAPGPVPAPAEPEPRGSASEPARPSRADVARADSLTRGIRDAKLREIVAKTVAFSLARRA